MLCCLICLGWNLHCTWFNHDSIMIQSWFYMMLKILNDLNGWCAEAAVGVHTYWKLNLGVLPPDCNSVLWRQHVGMETSWDFYGLCIPLDSDDMMTWGLSQRICFCWSIYPQGRVQRYAKSMRIRHLWVAWLCGIELHPTPRASQTTSS